jgi:hypothetical protein
MLIFSALDVQTLVTLGIDHLKTHQQIHHFSGWIFGMKVFLFSHSY